MHDVRLLLHSAFCILPPPLPVGLEGDGLGGQRWEGGCYKIARNKRVLVILIQKVRRRVSLRYLLTCIFPPLCAVLHAHLEALLLQPRLPWTYGVCGLCLSRMINAMILLRKSFIFLFFLLRKFTSFLEHSRVVKADDSSYQF